MKSCCTPGFDKFLNYKQILKIETIKSSERVAKHNTRMVCKMQRKETFISLPALINPYDL